MGNKRWTRMIAFVMALVCTLTVAAAVSFDRNGDGKTTVWDLQALFKGNDKDYDAAVTEVLGGINELAPITDGVYNIYSAMGLRVMANNADKGYTFNLMNDIDLDGMDWEPIADFKGTFNGNDKTISNFKITRSIYGSDGRSMGFFGSTKNASNEDPGRTKVNNLHLRNVQIIADGTDAAETPNNTNNVRYVGAVVGTNRGDVVDCTAVSVVTDQRIGLTHNVYYGSLVGRNTNYTPAGGTSTACGKIDGENELEITDNLTRASVGYKKPSTKVNSKMAIFFSEELDYTTKAAQRKTGIVGNSVAAGMLNTGLLWQDITNSTDIAPEGIQKRREEVARYMYEMCTVEWSPSKDMVYMVYKSGSDRSRVDYYTNGCEHANTWYEGGFYRGIPYNHGSSSLGRFNYWINNEDLPADAFYLTDNKVIETFNNALTDSSLYKTDTSGRKVLYTIYGEARNWTNMDHNFMPSDMDTALSVTGTYITGFGRYVGNDCSSAASWAWRRVSAVYGDGMATPSSTGNMFPSPAHINEDGGEFTGIVPINGLVFPDTENSSAKMAEVVKNYAKENADHYYDTLAKISKGDVLMGYIKAGGHTLVAISDAVAIRNWNGALDTQKSYVVTAEQGGGSTDSDGVDHTTGKVNGKTWSSSCGVDRRTTFADLVPVDSTKVTGKGNTKYYYFPITCAALREENTPAATVGLTYSGSTKVTSNFHIEATTKDGQITYSKTTNSNSRSRLINLDLTTVYPDIAKGDQVTVHLADGQSHTITYGTSYKTNYSVDANLPAVN